MKMGLEVLVRKNMLDAVLYVIKRTGFYFEDGKSTEILKVSTLNSVQVEILKVLFYNWICEDNAAVCIYSDDPLKGEIAYGQRQLER